MTSTSCTISRSRTILGIDPGFDRVGWAITRQNESTTTLIDCGCIVTDRKRTRFERYLQIEEQLTQIIEAFRPRAAGIEQLYAARNTTTVIPVAEARGIIIGCLLRADIQIHELNPSTIKFAVAGHGRADKAAMKKMVLLQLGSIAPSLRTKVEKTLDDTIDAIGVSFSVSALRSEW